MKPESPFKHPTEGKAVFDEKKGEWIWARSPIDMRGFKIYDQIGNGPLTRVKPGFSHDDLSFWLPGDLWETPAIKAWRERRELVKEAGGASVSGPTSQTGKTRRI